MSEIPQQIFTRLDKLSEEILEEVICSLYPTTRKDHVSSLELEKTLGDTDFPEIDLNELSLETLLDLIYHYEGNIQIESPIQDIDSYIRGTAFLALQDQARKEVKEFLGTVNEVIDEKNLCPGHVELVNNFSGYAHSSLQEFPDGVTVYEYRDIADGTNVDVWKIRKQILHAFIHAYK